LSLIERALGKLRRAEALQTAASAHRPALKIPQPRAVAEPQLRLTDDILERLGIKIEPAQESEFGRQRSSEYRHIKHQVVTQLQAGSGGRTVLVTSALAGEGKSYTSANLARSLAMEPDFTVLLVDADVVRPALSRAMGIADRRGLMNALADEALDVDSLILTTDIEGLAVLPAGSASQNATEYFGSERMRNVLTQLQSVPNRIVLIDSPPLLPTTEGRALIPFASQVLLVVRAESTPQTAVRQAVTLIDKDVNLRLLLNAMPRTRLTRYLGYDYGQDYGYGNDHDSKE